MFAFVNAALPVRAFGASLSSTCALRQGARAPRAAVRMADGEDAAPAPPAPPARSPSMPFANAPAGLSPDLPGYAGFDPLAFSSAFDIKFMQEAEIKHGRVCMLAVVGLVVPELFTFPFYSAPAGALPASTTMHDYFVKTGALQQIFLWICFAEVFGAFALKETLEGDRPAGYFGLDPLGIAGPVGTAKYAKFQLNEIKNGRLAMCAVGGIIHQQFITGQPTLYNLSHFKGVPVTF